MMGSKSQLTSKLYRRTGDSAVCVSLARSPITVAPKSRPVPNKKKIGASHHSGVAVIKPRAWLNASAGSITSSGVKAKPDSFTGEVSIVQCHQIIGR